MRKFLMLKKGFNGFWKIIFSVTLKKIHQDTPKLAVKDQNIEVDCNNKHSQGIALNKIRLISNNIFGITTKLT